MRKGFTLTELLIVVAIVVLLLLLLMLSIKTQLARGRDARRKSDLDKIQRAFEEYLNDKACYPPSNVLSNCGSTDFSPFLDRVLCDPTSKQPYLYIPGAPDMCAMYHVCAKLEDKSDPDIARIGCNPYTGCGFGAGYNYCIAVGSSVTAVGFDAGLGTATPTPTTQYSGNYACTPGGVCNLYDDPQMHGCPMSYSDTNCNGRCTVLANRCAN